MDSQNGELIMWSYSLKFCQNSYESQSVFSRNKQCFYIEVLTDVSIDKNLVFGYIES